MGVPHLLMRTAGCNLRCVFRDSICDTPYSSHNPETPLNTMENAIALIDSNPQIKHTLITGGEPTIQADLPFLVTLLKNSGHYVTIETNGTRKVDLPIDLYSISPKLANSVDKNEGTARTFQLKNNTYENIVWYRDNKRCQFKFVISDEETLRLVEDFIKEYELNPKTVWLMPEGIEAEHLATKRKFVAEYAIKKGYNYTDRLHIVIYGNQRIS